MQFRLPLSDRDRDPSLGTCPLTGKRILPGNQKYVKHHMYGYLLMVHRDAEYCFDDSDGRRYLQTYCCDHCGNTYRRGGNGYEINDNDAGLCGECYSESEHEEQSRYRNRYHSGNYGDPAGGSSRFSLCQLDKDRPLDFNGVTETFRSVLGDAWKFYTLRWLELAIDYPPDGLVESVHHLSADQARSYSSRAITKLHQDVQDLKACHTERLAYDMYNYIILASAGEARYALKFFNPDHLGKLDSNTQFLFDLCDLPFGASTSYIPSRQAVWSKLESGNVSLTPLSVNQYTKAVTDLFNRKWRSSYGGSSWALIANSLPLYHQNLDVFIDHGFDLQHNNGCAFNKGDIFSHCDVVKLFLDLKRDARNPDHYISMLAKHWKMIFGAGSYNAYDSLLLPAFEIRQLIHRACKLGLVRQEINNAYDLEFDPRYIERNLHQVEEEFFRRTGIDPTCYQEDYSDHLDKWLYWKDHYSKHPLAETLASIYQQLSGGQDQPEVSDITIEDVPF